MGRGMVMIHCITGTHRHGVTLFLGVPQDRERHSATHLIQTSELTQQKPDQVGSPPKTIRSVLFCFPPFVRIMCLRLPTPVIRVLGFSRFTGREVTRRQFSGSCPVGENRDFLRN